jgi:hypothetical protein
MAMNVPHTESPPLNSAANQKGDELTVTPVAAINYSSNTVLFRNEDGRLVRQQPEGNLADDGNSTVPHGNGLTMDEVALLMREQDADLLESIHLLPPSLLATPNISSTSAPPHDSTTGTPTLSDIPLLRLHPPAAATAAGLFVKEASERLQRTLSLSSYTDQQPQMPSGVSGGTHIFDTLDGVSRTSPVAEPPTFGVVPRGCQPMRSTEPLRRALSGEVWLTEPPTAAGVSVVKEDQANVDPNCSQVTYESPQKGTTIGMLPTDSTLDESCPKIDPQSAADHVQRTESMDRRWSEVAQFAEAVGDSIDQEGLRIIEETEDQGDDDDDDDNAPEIHITRRDPSHPVNLPTEQDHAPSEGASTDTFSVAEQATTSTSTVKATSHSGATHNGEADLAISPRPPKTRPQWPFRGAGTTRITIAAPDGVATMAKRNFLDKLPESGTAASYVYKGIRANPPDIVQSGTNRGNYATLHRKAWLEVSDKYHRYGKHLRLYYRHWESLGCPTNMFFDWLDSKGEAAGQPLPELDECRRSQLDSDTVLYISNPQVSQGYALKCIPDEKGRGLVVDVDGDPVGTGVDGWIFVLRDNVLYGAQKITSVTGHSKQRFHHSSFFGGKAVAAAGIFITDEHGFLNRLYPHSGHYRPGEAHMQRMLFFLYLEGVDLRTFEVDTQQILHVARDKDLPKQKNDLVEESAKTEKRKKIESLHLMPGVLVACFLAHKARFIGEGIFSQIRQIRKANVATVSEALLAIDDEDSRRMNLTQRSIG